MSSTRRELIARAVTLAVLPAAVAITPKANAEPEHPDAELLDAVEALHRNHREYIDMVDARDTAVFAARNAYPERPKYLQVRLKEATGAPFYRPAIEDDLRQRADYFLNTKRHQEKLADLRRFEAEEEEIDRQHGIEAWDDKISAHCDEYIEIILKIGETPAQTMDGLIAKLRAAYLDGAFRERMNDNPEDITASIVADCERLRPNNGKFI